MPTMPNLFCYETTLSQSVELGQALLDHFGKLPNSPITKEALTKLVQNHQLYFENKPVPFLPFKVFKKGKAQIYLNLPKAWAPSDKDFLFEDKWLIILNKPSGLPSQSSLKPLQEHAYSAVKCHLRNKNPKTSPPLFLTHRLDMDTSGVLLMSKKSSANPGLQKLFERKEIQKTYLALSKSPEKPFAKKNITSYLERQPDRRHKFKFGSAQKEHPKAKFAETHVELLWSEKDLHLFKVKPKTGRSHQIRVHLKEAGFPILGDSFYNGAKSSHLFLHARSLSFEHPMTKAPLIVQAPLPKHWFEALKPQIDLSSLEL